MKLVVVGGSGFLGSRVVSRMVARGHTVVGLARSEAATSKLQAVGASVVDGDLDRPDGLRDAFASSGADTLLTSVSLGSGYGPPLVDAAEGAGIGRAVFTSTTSIYTSLDSASKPARLEAEARIMASTLGWTIVRPSMIYGAPGDRNMSRLLRALRRFPVFPLPAGGRGLQQPVHVDDLADAIVVALTDPVAIGKCYDLAGPEALPFREVIALGAAAVGRKTITFPVSLRSLIAITRRYEAMSRNPRLRVEQFERLAEDKAFDITLARAELGFNPRSFAEGIRQEADRTFHPLG
jgi:nucleoside-diphosphate-sugar epimerase